MSLIYGCTKTTEVASVSTGQIVGSVQLQELDCSFSASSAGVNVQILGTTFATVTDSAGAFVFDNLPAGYYSISFSKTGFTKYVLSPVEFVGAGTLHNVYAGLDRINNWKTTVNPPTITKDFSDPPDTNFVMSFASNPPVILDSSGNNAGTGAIYCFIGKSPNINYQDSSTYIAWTESNYLPEIKINTTRAKDGDTIYMVAYPAQTYCYGGYFNYSYYSGDTLKTQFCGFGPPSNVIKLVLP